MHLFLIVTAPFSRSRTQIKVLFHFIKNNHTFLVKFYGLIIYKYYAYNVFIINNPALSVRCPLNIGCKARDEMLSVRSEVSMCTL